MSCASYFTLLNAPVTLTESDTTITTADGLEVLITTNAAASCLTIIDGGIAYLNSKNLAIVSATVNLLGIEFEYTGTPNPGTYFEVAFDYKLGGVYVDAGYIRGNITVDGIEKVNFLLVDDVTFGTLAAGVSEFRIASISYTGVHGGTVTAIKVPCNGNVTGVDMGGYVGCLVSKCGIPSKINGLTGNRKRLGNFSFHLDPILHGKK